MRLERAYYYCARCRQGHCPVDRVLGLGPAATTPAVQPTVTALAARLPYTQVPLVLTQLGLRYRPCVKSVEAIAQRLGAQLADAPTVSHFPRAERELVIAADGIFLPTREGKREVRCAVIYEPEWDADRTPTACANLRKEYLATTESREDLMAAACARVERRRPRGAVIAALGDGAGCPQGADLDGLCPAPAAPG